jgi:hypothetical protein
VATNFSIITYKLPSEFKGDKKNTTSFYVKNRMKFGKKINKSGVKLGTSLYAVSNDKIDELKEFLNLAYKDDDFSFLILGEADMGILLKTLKESLGDFTEKIIDFLKEENPSKKKLKDMKPLLTVAMNRLRYYETLSEEKYENRDSFFEATTKRAKLLV